MAASVSRKAIFISLLGHITVFSIFSLSFGNIIPPRQYIYVNFWGQLLSTSQVSAPSNQAGVLNTRFIRKPDIAILNNASEELKLPSGSYFRPRLNLAIIKEREPFIDKLPAFSPPKRNEPTIVFHPILPYSFPLYFKDRQIAHVELMFKTIASGSRNSILVKRKISSGNLEVDLLVMRYIGHYLFLQQPDFTPINWQTVKIDLSAKND